MLSMQKRQDVLEIGEIKEVIELFNLRNLHIIEERNNHIEK